MSHNGSSSNQVSQATSLPGHEQILPFTCHNTERFSRIEDVLNKLGVLSVTIHEDKDSTLSIEFRDGDSIESWGRRYERFSFTTPTELKQAILKEKHRQLQQNDV